MFNLIRAKSFGRVYLLAFSVLISAAQSRADTQSIQQFPYIIVQQGIYRVDADTPANFSATAITINASNVVLFLNGHSLTGTGTNEGIDTGPGVSNIIVQGPGTISNFSVGLRMNSATNCRITQVTAIGNNVGFSIGFDASFLNLVRNDSERNAVDGFVVSGKNNFFVGNRASNNGLAGNAGHGFWVYNGGYNTFDGNECNNNSEDGILLTGTGADGNTIIRNSAQGNNNIGIRTTKEPTGNLIQANSALGNTKGDLADQSGVCSNVWVNNLYNTKNLACIN